MSLCDVCMDPGACCRRMVISGGDEDRAEAPMSFERAEHFMLARGLPFRPAEPAELEKAA